MESFIDEESEDVPSSSVCPRLNERVKALRENLYGNIELEMGWFGGGDHGIPVDWQAREIRGMCTWLNLVHA